MSGQARPDMRGVVACPWACGRPVRRTVNGNAKVVHVNLDPDPRGIIAAYWDGGVWRSRQLHKGETLAGHEQRWLIHRATCWRLARMNRAPARSPRPVLVAPPPGPMPVELAADTRAELEKIRRRRMDDAT